MRTLWFTMMMLLFLSSCGQDPLHEHYPIYDVADLQLTEANHPHGYGQSDCFFCHIPVNIHSDDTLGTGNIELARQLTQSQGTRSCSTCHGNNGVTP